MLAAASRRAALVPHRNYRHCAIVLRGGNVIAQASNVSRHAEVAALSKLRPGERVGTTVMSLRFTRGNKLAMALPCPACMAFLRLSKVKNVSWSDEVGLVHHARLRDLV